MSFVKYRVQEVAADFGVTPKDIAEIVGKYFEKPRSNTQVLTGCKYPMELHKLLSAFLNRQTYESPAEAGRIGLEI